MFDVGFWELTIIAVVALVVVGPERLPRLARTAGQWMGRARRLARELRMELEREVDLSEVRRLHDDVTAAGQSGNAKDPDDVLSGSVDVDPTENR
jgi:Tat protein translocase TatB subunit